MNSHVYRNILRTLEHWPLDQTKKGRDFGEFIRKQVGTYFTTTSQQTPKEHIWDDISLRLGALASNKYKQRFAVPKITGSCGLSEEDCKFAISTESLKEVEQEFTAYSRFVGRIRQTKNRFFPPMP